MEQTAQKQRVAVYCRVDSGGNDLSACLATQTEHYTEMVGGHPDWELAGIYADQGIASADYRNRVEFKKMLTACKRGKINLILTRSISRFSRNIPDCLETVRMLKANGVSVIFEKEGIDTRTDSDELRTALFNEFARMESESLTKNFIYPVWKRPHPSK